MAPADDPDGTVGTPVQGILLAAAMFVFVIDTSFMNVSISAVVEDLDTTVSGVQSAVVIEALVSAAFILISSKVGDLFGRKRAFVLGMVFYAVGALAMVALFILAITWLYAAIGLAAANPTAASGYGFALLFVPYLSSAFVPTDTMPTWLQWIAENQPITPIIETIRAFLFGRDPGSDLWWALGWCALIIVGAYVWAVWLFRRKAGRR